MIGIVNDENKKEYPVEQEQNMSMQQIQNTIGQVALQLGGIADTLGVIGNTVKRHEVEISTAKEEISTLKHDFETYKEIQADKEFILPKRVNELSNAVETRVSDLLRQHNRFDLYGRFKAQLWRNAKRYSYMVGKAGVYTQDKYFHEVMDYIGRWEPENYGTVGYINHLDSLRESKK